jgi:hypothetical protein
MASGTRRQRHDNVMSTGGENTLYSGMGINGIYSYSYPTKCFFRRLTPSIVNGKRILTNDTPERATGLGSDHGCRTHDGRWLLIFAIRIVPLAKE